MVIRSIRWFLLVMLLLLALAGSLAVGALTYFQAAHEVEELFDADLAQLARVLAGLLDPETAETRGPELASSLARAGEAGGLDDDEPTALGHPYETKLGFQLRGADGRLVFSSPEAPEEPLAPLAAGFSWEMHGGFRWRVFTLADEADANWIQVAQRADVRGELAGEIAIDLLVQSLLGLPVLLLIVPLIVVAAFAPVQRIAAELRARTPGNLHPIDTQRVPEEVRGLVGSLNHLFRRLAMAFEAERRFTADAAHELRTPIAALLVHAENARRTRSEEARAASLDRITTGARRLQRLVEQLLTLSRLDPDAGLGEWQQVDLAAVAADEARQAGAQAERAGVRLECDFRSLPPVHGNGVMLGVLVRNLIDNALRHSPPGGRVRLSGRRVAESVEFVVEDEGPGVPPALRERVLERFYRAPGQRGEGSGLGLSIVRRIAEIHGATLRLDDAAPGLSVVVAFAPEGGIPPESDMNFSLQASEKPASHAALDSSQPEQHGSFSRDAVRPPSRS